MDTCVCMQVLMYSLSIIVYMCIVAMGLAFHLVVHMRSTWVVTYGCRQCRELALTYTFDSGILMGKWKAFASNWQQCADFTFNQLAAVQCAISVVLWSAGLTQLLLTITVSNYLLIRSYLKLLTIIKTDCCIYAKPNIPSASTFSSGHIDMTLVKCVQFGFDLNNIWLLSFTAFCPVSQRKLPRLIFYNLKKLEPILIISGALLCRR